MTGFLAPLRHSLHRLVILVGLFAFTFVWANNIALNFAIICIVPPNGTNASGSCGATNDPKAHFYHYFSPQQRNLLFSAAAIGAIFSSLCATHLIDSLGTRRAFTLCGFASGLSCLALPVAVTFGVVPTFVLRLVQGTGHPFQYIMINHFSKEWSPAAKSGTYILLLSIQFQLGPMLMIPISGLLCESQLGWPALYYVQGALTLVAFCALHAVFRDTPREHPWISNKELKRILKGRPTAPEDPPPAGGDAVAPTQVPYRRMLTDPVMLLALLTFASTELGFLVFTQYGPIYLHRNYWLRVVGLDVARTGFITALRLGAAMCAKVVAGPVNDRLPWKNERVRIGIFAAVSQGGMALSFLALTLLPRIEGSPQWLVLVVYSAVNTFSGLDFLGIIRASTRLSQQFSPTIMVWESMLSNACVLLLPQVVGLVVGDNSSVRQWSLILAGCAFFELLTLALFYAFCDTKPRPWTHAPSAESAVGGGKRVACWSPTVRNETDLEHCGQGVNEMPFGRTGNGIEMNRLT